MSITERSEILAQVYKLRSDAGALYARCQEARALHIAVSIQCVQNHLNEILDDCKPDAPDYFVPPDFVMASPKH